MHRSSLKSMKINQEIRTLLMMNSLEVQNEDLKMSSKIRFLFLELRRPFSFLRTRDLASLNPFIMRAPTTMSRR